ncbi:MAG: hypothetical protein OEY36_01285 [Gammaproteobacteria bacterium]|nr:hypothetical protein [Gammaproteobacteria bacterium]
MTLQSFVRICSVLLSIFLWSCDSEPSTDNGTTPPDNNSSLPDLTGSWKLLEVDGAAALNDIYFTFNSDASFSYTELNGELPNGVESGSYSYTADTLVTTVTTDNIGASLQQDGGIDNYGNPFSLSYTLVSNLLTLTSPDNNIFTFERMSTSFTGALDTGTADFDDHILVFFPNNTYFQWCNTTDGNCSSDSYEIGTYTQSDATYTINSHITEGDGGFDPVGLQFDVSSTAVDTTTGAHSLTAIPSDPTGAIDFVQVIDAGSQIVGAWLIDDANNTPLAYDPASSQLLVFYSDGTYFQWSHPSSGTTGCNDASTPLAEIGTYSVSYSDAGDGTINGQLTINSHIQNGVGGFDNDTDPCQIPATAINFNIDGHSLSFTDWGFSMTRVH